MNQKLLEFAVEALHRDPDFMAQETKTALNKFFSSRKNIDELILLIRGGSPTERADLNRAILSLQINECKLRKEILTLENEISRLKRTNAFNSIDDEYLKRKPRARDAHNIAEKTNESRAPNKPKNTEDSNAPVEKKVKVWTRGIRSD